MHLDDCKFFDTSELLLFEAMKKCLPKSCTGKESKLYLVTPSIQMYTKGNCAAFHATRYATTDEGHILNVHVDSQNPRQHDGLEDSFMIMPVVCYTVKEGDKRCTIIGYGRDSIVGAAI
eukprot:5375569-Ditylum_brightwellii.AAC.1